MTNHLYYGDNLDVLRESIRDESVDLIYLDPPFNSNATYNVLFRAPSGEASQAQIEAFEDTWHWNDAAERAFDDVMQSGNVQAADMLRALRSFLRDNDVMAYRHSTATRSRAPRVSIEELLGGKRPRIPLVERAFRETQVEYMEEQSELDL
jgi:DNA modification methylase